METKEVERKMNMLNVLGVIIVVQFTLFYRIHIEIDNLNERINTLHKGFDYKLHLTNKKLVTPEKKGKVQHREVVGVFVRKFATPRFKTRYKLEKGEWFKNNNEFYKVIELIDIEVNEKVVNHKPTYVYAVEEIKEEL